MDIKIEFKGLKELQAKLTDLEKKQFPYAAAKALTKTTESVIRAEQQQMRIHIKGGPTQWTLGGMYVKPATKTNLVAEVGYKDKSSIRVTTTNKGQGTPAAYYMQPLVDGGPRNLKGFESSLRWAYILPRDMYIVPGAACPLDAHGNIPHGFITKILSYFKAAERYAGRTANTTDEGRRKLKEGTRRKVGLEYFVSYGKGRMTGRGRNFPQHLPPGIYVKYSGSGTKTIRPIMMFVKRPMYSKRLPFYETAQKVIDIMFREHFNEAMDEAIKTAK